MKPVLEQTLVRVALPEMGESVTEGSVVEWRKNVGDFVAEGDPLVEVTTDKVDVEVPATASGVVTQILAREGETVAVGSALAEIDTSKSAATPTVSPGDGERRCRAGKAVACAHCAAGCRSGAGIADPPARRIARQLDVDLNRVRGSGPNGLIFRSDVLARSESARRAPTAPGPPLPPIPPNAQAAPHSKAPPRR